MRGVEKEQPMVSTLLFVIMMLDQTLKAFTENALLYFDSHTFIYIISPS